MPDDKTISPEEYTKAIERARTLEARTVDLEKRLENYKGIDPEAVKAMKEDYELLRKESTGGDKTKIDKLIADKESEAHKRYGSKIEELTGQLTDAQSELKKLRVTNVAMQKAGALFTQDSLKFIEREVEAACDWDGSIVVKGEDGKPLPSKRDPRRNMEIDEYLEGLAALHPSIAKSNATGGGMKPGTTSPAGSSGTITIDQYKQMSQAERLKLPIDLRTKFSQEILKGAKLTSF